MATCKVVLKLLLKLLFSLHAACILHDMHVTYVKQLKKSLTKVLIRVYTTCTCTVCTHIDLGSAYV